MAENAPPASSVGAAADGSRGMPYYEKLRRDLRDSLNKKRVIDAQLFQMEDAITRMETAYLEETTAGNIIKGFDNYIKGAATTTAAGGAGTATRRKAPISDADRIFSRSSTSFLREASTPATTPSHAPTPTSSFPTRENSHATSNGHKTGGGGKKKKTTTTATEDDDDGNKSKRQKISYGRE